MAMIIDELQGSWFTYTVNASNRVQSDNYSLNQRTVNWNPEFAVQDPDGNVVSPALALGHELAHAFLGWFWGRVFYWYPSPSGPNTPNFDEWFAFGVENAAAKTLGDGIRTIYTGGGYISVIGPLCHPYCYAPH